jgi:hypothetical protein
MFSSRIPGDLDLNRLTRALSRIRSEGRRVIDLTESNPTRCGFSYPEELLAPLADPRALDYAPEPFGLPSARASVAADFLRRGRPVAADRVVLTASTSDAYSLIFKLLCDSGDEVLVPRPSYPLFDHLARLESVVPVSYSIEYFGRWSLDLASLVGALSARTRAILVVNPNNPTGHFASSDDLGRLEALCVERNLALVSDEVFADFELTNGASATAGLLPGRDAALSFTLGGLSKSVGLPQLKLGWMALGGPVRLVEDALERLEVACDTYLSVSTPVQIAAPALLERGAVVRAQIRDRVRHNHHLLTVLAGDVPSCSVLRADGGWYGVVQVPSRASEEELVLALLAEDGVLVHPGYFFDFPTESFLVLSLLVPEALFEEGVARMFRRFS